MWSSLRRFTAAAVCFSLILTCAGLEPYAAFGASFNSAPETARVPSVALPRPPVPARGAMPATLPMAAALPGLSVDGGALAAPVTVIDHSAAAAAPAAPAAAAAAEPAASA